MIIVSWESQRATTVYRAVEVLLRDQIMVYVGRWLSGQCELYQHNKMSVPVDNEKLNVMFSYSSHNSQYRIQNHLKGENGAAVGLIFFFVNRNCTDIILILIRCWPLAWPSRLLRGRDKHYRLHSQLPNKPSRQFMRELTVSQHALDASLSVP